MEILLEYFAKGLMTMLMIAMPCVLTAAGIGLIVGILQAVTQVQEQTIAAAPKIFSVFLVIMLLGTGYLKLLTNLFEEGGNIAFEVIPKTENRVIPADYYKYTKPFWDEMQADVNTDMIPMSEILNNAAKPGTLAQSERFEKLRKGSKETPTPSFLEKKTINEKR